MKGYRSVRGLTMIELLVTMTIAAILAVLAVPAFKGLLDSNRAQAQASLLFQALNYARSEAVHQNTEVRVTALSGNTDWAQGWRVWIDANGNDTYDAGEELRNQSAFTGGPTLTGSVSEVKFLASGFQDDGSSAFTAADTTFSYSMPSSLSYCTKVAHTGRVSFQNGACP